MWNSLPHGSIPISKLLPYLNDNACARIKLLCENPKSVLVAAFPYYAGDAAGNISKYARGRDYHLTVKELLNKKCESLKAEYPTKNFIPLVDASPIPEVIAGALSGIGVIGRNGLLINPEFGSFFFLGCILTDLETDRNINIPQTCIGCDECICHCPTKALGKDGFNRSLCLSHITQKRSDFNAFEESSLKLGKSVWGCDICQNVCPYNKKVKLSVISDFTENLINNLDISEIINLDDSSFKVNFGDRAFAWRGVAPLKRNLKILYSPE